MIEAAADLLHEIITKVQTGELRASGRVVARLEGAELGLRAAVRPTQERRKAQKDV